MPSEREFKIALGIARDQYRNVDPERQAERSGSLWSQGTSGGESATCRAELPFLGTPYVIEGPDGDVRYRDESDREPALWEKILLLHYFTTADGSPIVQKWITVKEIPDSRLYLPNFEKRAVAPLLGRFGGAPEQVVEPARKVGGRQTDVGDVAVTIPALPRVPLTLQFWKGDEEFPPRVNILFDESIVCYLPTEDIILTSQMLAFRLIGLAGK